MTNTQRRSEHEQELATKRPESRAEATSKQGDGPGTCERASRDPAEKASERVIKKRERKKGERTHEVSKPTSER